MARDFPRVQGLELASLTADAERKLARQLCRELAPALGISLDRVTVLRLEPGSVIAHLRILGDPEQSKTALVALAKQLRGLVKDRSGPLYRGEIGRSIDRSYNATIRVIQAEKMKIQNKGSPLPAVGLAASLWASQTGEESAARTEDWLSEGSPSPAKRTSQSLLRPPSSATPSPQHKATTSPGFVSRLASPSTGKAKSGGPVVALFVSADHDKDGLLTHGELVRHLHQVPWAAPLLRAQLRWEEIWKEYDSDADGKLTREEFLRLYKEKLQPLMKRR